MQGHKKKVEKPVLNKGCGFILVNETNGHLEAKDLKVKGSDLEWSEHDGTRDDDHIVYLPRFSIANQSNWQPLSPLKVIFILVIYIFIIYLFQGTKVKLDPLLEKKTLKCDVVYQFQVAVFHELGMRGAYRNASGYYQKSTCSIYISSRDSKICFLM